MTTFTKPPIKKTSEQDGPMAEAMILGADGWPPRAVALLHWLSSLPTPRVASSASVNRNLQPVSMLDLATFLYGEVYNAHLAILYREHQDCARYNTWRSIEKVLERPSGAAAFKLHAKQSWYNAGTETLLGCLAESLRNRKDLLHPGFVTAPSGVIPFLNNTISSRDPTDLICRTPSNTPRPNFNAATSSGLLESLTRIIVDDAALGTSEADAEACALDEMTDGGSEARVEQVAEGDMQYGKVWPGKNPFAFGRRTTPQESLGQIPSTKADAVHLLKRMTIRAMIFKNGVTPSYAQDIWEACAPLVGLDKWDLDQLHALIAARYSCYPRSLLAKTPLLDRQFASVEPFAEHDLCEGWGYLKIADVDPLQTASVLRNTRNQFTKARLGGIVDGSALGRFTDPLAKAIASRLGIIGSVSPSNKINFVQAGLLARLPRYRLMLEQQELGRLNRGETERPRSWVEMVAAGPGEDGRTSDYYGVIRYSEVQRAMGWVDTFTARMSTELFLFALTEGPSNLNVIKLGDIARSEADTSAILNALTSAGYTLDSDDEMTPLLLEAAGYKTGDPRTVLLTANQLDVVPVVLDRQIDVKVQNLHLQSRLVFAHCDKSSHIRLVPLMDVFPADGGPVMRGPEGSGFNGVDVLQLHLTSHPFIAGQFTFICPKPLSQGQTDWWLNLTGGAMNNGRREHETFHAQSLKLVKLIPACREFMDLGKDVFVNHHLAGDARKYTHLGPPTIIEVPQKINLLVLAWADRWGTLKENLMLVDSAEAIRLEDEGRSVALEGISNELEKPDDEFDVGSAWRSALLWEVTGRARLEDPQTGFKSSCFSTLGIQDRLDKFAEVVSYLDRQFVGWRGAPMPIPEAMYEASMKSLQTSVDEYYESRHP